MLILHSSFYEKAEEINQANIENPAFSMPFWSANSQIGNTQHWDFKNTQIASWELSHFQIWDFYGFFLIPKKIPKWEFGIFSL